MISGYQLFSTPFSAKYTDVIDTLPSGVEDLRTFLENNFEHSSLVYLHENQYKVYEETEKGCRFVIEIDVDNILSSTIPKYNYIMLRKIQFIDSSIDYKDVYYFVESFKILKEHMGVTEAGAEEFGVDKITYDFTLVRDVWHSNFTDIISKLSGQKYNIERFIDNSVRMVALEKNYFSNSSILPTLGGERFIKNVDYQGFFIFLKFIVNPEVMQHKELTYYIRPNYTSQGLAESYRIFAPTLEKALPCLYLPLYYVTTKPNNDDVEIYRIGNVTDSEHNKTLFIKNYHTTLQKLLSAVGGDANKFVDVNLTTIAPFNMSVLYLDTDNMTCRVDTDNSDYISFSTSDIDDYFKQGLTQGESPYCYMLMPYIADNLSNKVIIKNKKIRLRNFYNGTSHSYNVDTFDRITENENYILNSRNNIITRVSIGDLCIDIKNPYAIELDITYYFENSYCPNVTIKCRYIKNGVESDYETLVFKKPVYKRYDISTTAEKYTEYRNMYGYQEDFLYTLSTLVSGLGALGVAAMASNPATGVVAISSYAINSIINMDKIIMKQDAMKKMLSNVDYGENKYGNTMLDSLIIEYNYVDADDNIFNNKLKEIKMFGIECANIDDITLQYRELYDFKKTNIDELKISYPNYDKEIIKEMFNKGVTLWHNDIHTSVSYIGNYACTNNNR